MQKGFDFRSISWNLQDLSNGEVDGKRGEEELRVTTVNGCDYHEPIHEIHKEDQVCGRR